MKKLLLGLAALGFLVTACKDESKPVSAEPATADTAAVETEKEPTKEESDKAWQAYMTPGAMHQWMAKSNGTWEGDITMWTHPDSPAMKMKGIAVYKSILDGRYQEGIHKSNMMGMPFEGRSLVAYDNAKKVFISSWIDNMGTGVMNLEGTYDEKTKTLTSTGKMVDPVSGKDCDVRELITYVDDNTQKMEMYCKIRGKEVKTMEMLSKRKK